MKVLIISHNPITTYQNMGKTLMSLFSSFQKSELCQLYIYPTIPDIEKCNSYYRITDQDVFKSFTRLGKVKSCVITTEDIDVNVHELYESKSDESFLDKSRKNTFTLLCRDIMWRFSHWYNLKLKEWLAQEKPSCIFLVPGRSKFIYNIALRISKALNIPIITYIADEYYFVNKPKGFLDQFSTFLLKKKINKVLCKSENIIAICDEIADAYRKEFSAKIYTVFTGSNYPVSNGPRPYSEIKGLSYMGNTGCNRYLSLAEIGRCLDELNCEHGTDYSLFLYTAQFDEIIRQYFSNIKSIHFCGYVTGDDFIKVMYDSPILLHVEAFDDESIDRVKHSISTKIADSLGCGNLLFAYGPKQVASMHHLIKHKCAEIVVDPNHLKSALFKVLSGENRYETINNALNTANNYHVSENNSLKLREIIDRLEKNTR